MRFEAPIPPADNQPKTAALGDVVVELVDHLDAMVAYWDIDQVCVFANHAYLHWFGKTREQMLGTTL